MHLCWKLYFFKKSSLNLLQYGFCFIFWFFGRQACGILAPWPGIEPAPPALEGEVLTTGPPGKSQWWPFSGASPPAHSRAPGGPACVKEPPSLTPVLSLGIWNCDSLCVAGTKRWSRQGLGAPDGLLLPRSQRREPSCPSPAFYTSLSWLKCVQMVFAIWTLTKKGYICAKISSDPFFQDYIMYKANKERKGGSTIKKCNLTIFKSIHMDFIPSTSLQNSPLLFILFNLYYRLVTWQTTYYYSFLAPQREDWVCETDDFWLSLQITSHTQVKAHARL